MAQKYPDNQKKAQKFFKSKSFLVLVPIAIVFLITAGVWAATNIGADDIDTDGNLTVNGMAGIKNAAPSFDLDVNGNARITNNNPLYFAGTGALDTTGYLRHDGTDFIFSTAIKPMGYKSSGGDSGIAIGFNIKDKNGVNCALNFRDGLLISTTCPANIFE